MSREIYILYSWAVKARVYRRRSKRVRIEVFNVPSNCRELAEFQVNKHFKGAYVQEIMELKPVRIINAFYKDNLDWLTKDEIATLTIPTEL